MIMAEGCSGVLQHRRDHAIIERISHGQTYRSRNSDYSQTETSCCEVDAHTAGEAVVFKLLCHMPLARYRSGLYIGRILYIKTTHSCRNPKENEAA